MSTQYLLQAGQSNTFVCTTFDSYLLYYSVASTGSVNIVIIDNAGIQLGAFVVSYSGVVQVDLPIGSHVITTSDAVSIRLEKVGFNVGHTFAVSYQHGYTIPSNLVKTVCPGHIEQNDDEDQDDDEECDQGRLDLQVCIDKMEYTHVTRTKIKTIVKPNHVYDARPHYLLDLNRLTSFDYKLTDLKTNETKVGVFSLDISKDYNKLSELVESMADITDDQIQLIADDMLTIDQSIMDELHNTFSGAEFKHGVSIGSKSLKVGDHKFKFRHETVEGLTLIYTDSGRIWAIPLSTTPNDIHPVYEDFGYGPELV